MYQYKDLYTIDFTNVKYYFEMHMIIRDALDWPEGYGCNWSAFWDCLTNMVGRQVHIEIIGMEVIEQRFGEETGTKMTGILKDYKHYEDDEFADEIQLEIVRDGVREKLE